MLFLVNRALGRRRRRRGPGRDMVANVSHIHIYACATQPGGTGGVIDELDRGPFNILQQSLLDLRSVHRRHRERLALRKYRGFICIGGKRYRCNTLLVQDAFPVGRPLAARVVPSRSVTPTLVLATKIATHD